MNSDVRLTRLRYEAELLEEGDAEAASESTSASSTPTGMMAKLQEDIAGLSMEEKVARLEEVYVDLDALVSTRFLQGCGFLPLVTR